MTTRTILSVFVRQCLRTPPVIRSVPRSRNGILQRSPPFTSTSKLLREETSFHTSAYREAQSPTADTLMEELTELYATAKDEFEIAAEETEKKTVYAQEDRDAAREALNLLKNGFNKAVKESDPEVAKEVTSRVGQRIRELENAVTAMEESAMED